MFVFVLDIPKAGSYHDSTRQQLYNQRLAAMNDPNNHRGIVDVQLKFDSVIDAGFSRRSKSNFKNKNFEHPFASMSKQSALDVAEIFELNKPKSQVLAEMQMLKQKSRSPLVQMLPESTHKYFDYLKSLKIVPSKGDQTKSIGLATLFSFIVLMNQGARQAFMYYVVSNIITASMLLGRNMPKANQHVPGQRRQVGVWSKNSFRSAVAITLMYSLSSGLGSLLLLSVFFPKKFDVTARLAMVISMYVGAYASTFYEVYEEKKKNGWRWRLAMKNDDEAKFMANAKEKFGKEVVKGVYDYAYDPQIDDYPRQPKYLDEVDGTDPINNSNAGDIDEKDSEEHFVRWRVARKDARKAPILDAESDAPWVGSKAGMFVKNIPKWLQDSYARNVLKANKWRFKPTRFEKDFTEFEPIEGPWGFRDKRVEWLDWVGGIFEEKISVSRKAARVFGTYRKTMWKIDKEVKLQPCDGADK